MILDKKLTEANRMEHALWKISELGYNPIQEDDSTITFEFKGREIRFFPFSGWHTGKTIRDGRGLQKLLNQIK